MGSSTKHFLSVRAESAERPSPSQMQMYRRWSDEITHIVQFQTRPPTTTTTWVKTIRHRVISGPFLSIHSQRPARTTRRNARPSRKTHRIGLRSYTAEKFCSRLSHSAVSSSDSESASAGAFAPHVIGMPRAFPSSARPSATPFIGFGFGFGLSYTTVTMSMQTRDPEGVATRFQR
jgi:hypothetical protein